MDTSDKDFSEFSSGEYGACINGHGLYSAARFVLRLSPETHRRIAAYPTGIVSGVKDFEDLRAFSTYLHETIHWWQHIGSSAGFLMSMSFPVQTHANYSHLKSLLAAIGPKKSVRRFIEASTDGGGFGTSTGTANIIANNFYDIEFFRELVSNPASIPRVLRDPFYNWQGHCYEMGYSTIIASIARSADREFAVVPDARQWEAEFQKLRETKAEGWYLGSEVKVAPLGTLQIFEGQARFAQLQYLYLYFASEKKLTWDEIRARNMFAERYINAFEVFLRLSGLQWPPTVDDPIVGLFLLICDIAINPGEGFPLPIQFFEAFVTDVNPGMRFLFLCRVVARDRNLFATAIRNYSRDEYVAVAEALTRPLMIHHPLLVSQTAARWANPSPAFKDLMARFKNFDFGPENLPVSLLLSHFIAFNADKMRHPEFFCWTGAWMTGRRVSEEIVNLFDRHSALFVDKEDDDGVFPRVHSNRDEQMVQRTFESFYQFNVTYDMTSQWISNAGPFKYDYGWLSSKGTYDDRKNFADRGFEGVYGVSPDKFQLL